MIGRGGARIAVAIVAISILAGSLTGCGHLALGGSQTPAAGVTANTTAPAPVTGKDDS